MMMMMMMMMMMKRSVTNGKPRETVLWISDWIRSRGGEREGNFPPFLPFPFPRSHDGEALSFASSSLPLLAGDSFQFAIAASHRTQHSLSVRSFVARDWSAPQRGRRARSILPPRSRSSQPCEGGTAMALLILLRRAFVAVFSASFFRASPPSPSPSPSPSSSEKKLFAQL
jgi:hypothetical protein